MCLLLGGVTQLLIRLIFTVNSLDRGEQVIFANNIILAAHFVHLFLQQQVGRATRMGLIEFQSNNAKPSGTYTLMAELDVFHCPPASHLQIYKVYKPQIIIAPVCLCSLFNIAKSSQGCNLNCTTGCILSGCIGESALAQHNTATPNPPPACIDRSNVGRQTGREGSLLFITGAPTPPLSFLAPTNREPFISGRDMRVAGYEICPRRPLRGHHPIKPQAVHRPPHEYGQVTNIYEDNQERNIAATNSTFEDTGSHVNLRTQYTGPAVDKKTGMPVHIWQSFTRLYHLSPFVDLKSEELVIGAASKAFLDQLSRGITHN